MPTVAEIFEAMPERFDKEAAAGMNAVYQYEITGDDGGNWYTAIADGEITVSSGTHDNPNITLTISSGDYIDMIDGKLNGQMAFMTGKLKIKGDMALGMKLGSLFKTG